MQAEALGEQSQNAGRSCGECAPVRYNRILVHQYIISQYLMCQFNNVLVHQSTSILLTSITSNSSKEHQQISMQWFSSVSALNTGAPPHKTSKYSDEHVTSMLVPKTLTDECTKTRCLDASNTGHALAPWDSTVFCVSVHQCHSAPMQCVSCVSAVVSHSTVQCVSSGSTLQCQCTVDTDWLMHMTRKTLMLEMPLH